MRCEHLAESHKFFFRSSQGGRFVDQLVNGIADEPKVGYTALTKNIAKQIMKDVELVGSGEIRGSVWHFFRSSVTGLRGPSGRCVRPRRRQASG